MNILCIIPARAGSKGIPNKNIMNFREKPMMVWSIEQALQSKHEMRIVVSTDSEKYATIAKMNGAEAPFLRPSEISQDYSNDLEFITHAVDWYARHGNFHADVVLLLRPTQPLREVADIDACLDAYISNMNIYDSLRTVIPVDKTPFKMYTTRNNELVPLFQSFENMEEPYNQCRQLLPQCYLHNGYIDIYNADNCRNGTLCGSKMYAYIMDKTDNIDIDHVEDIPMEFRVQMKE